MFAADARRDAPAPLRYPDRIGSREPDTMKTDWSIYEFLATGPEAFRVLSDGVTLSGAYRFGSVTLKSIERRLDGVHEPEGHAGPIYISEFQAQPVPGAWYNLLTKIGLYGEQYPDCTVRGLLIFLRRADDPGAPPGAGPPLCTAVYLDETLHRWMELEPQNPYVAVFAPLIIRRREDLRAQAPAAWRTLQAAPLEPAVRATLERIFESWLIERLPTLTTQELRAMLPALVPLEQTRVYKEIFAEGETAGKIEGKAEGKAEGKVEGKADGLKRLLARRFGPLPAWAVRRLDTASLDQLDDWLDGFLDAQSIEALLGPAPRRGGAKPKS